MMKPAPWPRPPLRYPVRIRVTYREGHLLFGAEIGYISGLYPDTSSSEVVVTSNSKSLSKSRLFPQYFHGGHLN